jgi:hypothetical protein
MAKQRRILGGIDDDRQSIVIAKKSSEISLLKQSRFHQQYTIEL